jgi:acyl-CoA thioester hydrolase
MDVVLMTRQPNSDGAAVLSEPGSDPTIVSTTERPHPLRVRLDAYPIIRSLSPRYGDMDANRHLNNIALQAMHEDSRADLNARAFTGLYESGSHDIRIVTSQTVVHFLAEAHWPDPLISAIGIGRIGRSSFVASSALFRQGACVSVCDTVLVAVTDAGPVAIPDKSREVLRSLLLRELTAPPASDPEHRHG